MTTNINFGLLIRQLLKKQKVTIQTAAEMIGYTRQGFSDVMDKEDVNTQLLKKICLALGVEMNYFLSGTNTVISQKGEQNVFGEANEIYYKSNSNVTGKVNDGDILLLKMENEGLRNQIEAMKSQIDTQRELIELLKSK